MPDEDQQIEQGGQDTEGRSTIPRRKWRACCLAPTIAVAILLLYVTGAQLYDNRARLAGSRPDRTTAVVTQERRDAFLVFARAFFAAAKEADDANQAALEELQNMAQGSGSVERVHSAFRTARGLNNDASTRFRTMEIPQGIASKSKAQRSLELVARAYDARREACETMADWNGDVNDRNTADRFRKQVDQINRLTVQALQTLQSAAMDNGLNGDDLRRVASSGLAGNWESASDLLTGRR